MIAHQLLAFNRQVEHIAEVVVVVLAGALLATVDARPAGARIRTRRHPRRAAGGGGGSLAGAGVPARERRLLQWFGVRGIGSLYWLAFALNRGARRGRGVLTAATLGLVAVSVVAHGVSATPVMEWHLRRRRVTDRGTAWSRCYATLAATCLAGWVRPPGAPRGEEEIGGRPARLPERRGGCAGRGVRKGKRHSRSRLATT